MYPLTPLQGTVIFLVVALCIAVALAIVKSRKKEVQRTDWLERLAKLFRDWGLVRTAGVADALANGNETRARAILRETLRDAEEEGGMYRMLSGPVTVFLKKLVWTQDRKKEAPKYIKRLEKWGFDTTGAMVQAMLVDDAETLAKFPEWMSMTLDDDVKMEAEALTVAKAFLENNKNDNDDLIRITSAVAHAVRDNEFVLKSDLMWDLARSWMMVAASSKETCDRMTALYNEVHNTKCKNIPWDRLELIENTDIRLKDPEVYTTQRHTFDTKSENIRHDIETQTTAKTQQTVTQQLSPGIDTSPYGALSDAEKHAVLQAAAAGKQVNAAAAVTGAVGTVVPPGYSMPIPGGPVVAPGA